MTISDIDKLAAALDKLIPRALDGIITRHREHAELRLSTDDDLAQLHADVPYDESYAQDVDRWTLITLDWHPPKFPRQRTTRLLGYNKARGEEWHTSNVDKLDPRTGCLITHSGTCYRIVGPRSNEPDLLRVCAVLHDIGVGDYLGAMRILY